MQKKKIIPTVLLLSCLGLGSTILLSCTSTPNQESTGQFIDSSAITARVKSRLLAEKDLNKLAITVKTYKGVVELSGFVDNQHQRDKAGNIARSVEGVSSVHNSLIIKRHVAP